MNREKATIAITSIAIVIFLFFVTEALRLPPPLTRNAPSPSLFPLIGLTAAIAFAVIMLIQSFFALKVRNTAVDFHIRHLLPHIALLAAYILIMSIIGYVVASVAYLTTALYLTIHAWKKSFVIAAGFTAVLYVLFEMVLGVQLPVNPFV